MLPLHIEKSSQKSFSNCYEKISKQFLKIADYTETFQNARTGKMRYEYASD